MLEKAEENNIPIPTLRYRLNRGWDEEKACTHPLREKWDRQYWLKVAEENGVTRRMFDYRYYQKGWTPEKAATTPRMKTRTKKNDVDPYTHYKKLALKKGMAVAEFNRRIFDEGMSLEEAIH